MRNFCARFFRSFSRSVALAKSPCHFGQSRHDGCESLFLTFSLSLILSVSMRDVTREKLHARADQKSMNHSIESAVLRCYACKSMLHDRRSDAFFSSSLRRNCVNRNNGEKYLLTFTSRQACAKVIRKMSGSLETF